jgi:glycine/D-amino acid oxidase-like deaminating enzyme/nitrite reductase/ring-hydroxylating ferredoxin subunit
MMTKAVHPPGEHRSLWLATSATTAYPSLAEDLHVDVAIIGSGIAGLTTALLLKLAGKRVAVLEANQIIEGVTAHTTAKLTSLHTLIYDYLNHHFGAETAFAYGTANQAAVELVARLVDQHQIDCDFSRTAAYTYTQAEEEIPQIEAEVRAAQAIGLPAQFVSKPPLPFPIAAAIRFEDQARFHPRKYLLALAELIDGDGSYIFEQSKALDVEDGAPCRVTTALGAVTAEDVVIATHFPLKDNAFYFARMTPHFSYLLAMTLGGPVPEGMFINTDSSHTLRRHFGEGQELLLAGGQGHTTGQGGDTVARYQQIEAWARKYFPVEQVLYSWATQDYQTFDRIPYIGRMTPTSHHLYVATGFKGWGMSNGTAAAMILTDLITDIDNPWAKFFDPNRMDLASAAKMAKANVNVATQLAKGYLSVDTAEQIPVGEGRIVAGKEGRVAIYRAPGGSEHRLSPICPHMGCVVNWNPAEKSWDCPCHGSRFQATGAVIHGPAHTGLEPKE